MPRQSRIADILMAGSRQQAQMMNQAYGGLAQGMGGLFTGVEKGLESRRIKQEKEVLKQREKGILGGSMAVQQAAQQGQLSPEMLRSYGGSMQGLGMSPEDIMTKIKELQEINAAAQQQGKTNSFIGTLGPEYAALYEASGDFKAAYSQYLEDNQQESIATLAQQFDPELSDDFVLQMTSSDLVDLYESRKENSGAQAWAKWVNENPQITDDNRAGAITAAVAAFGKDAPKKVADLEAKQLEIRAKKEGKKSVPVIITMKTTAAFSGLDQLSGGRTQITTKNLPVNPDGTLSPDAENWLEDHASSAMVQDTGQTWGAAPDTSPDNTPSGQGDESTTLGQLLSPALQEQLTNTQM